MSSIDIVIPSFRLDEQYLLPLLQLVPPDDFSLNYYLVADNPAVKIPDTIQQLSRRDNVHLLVNSQNMGYSRTRNRGIDAGAGEWILFLDDDVIPKTNLLIAYARAVKERPGALGFVGVTAFPEPFNAVTHALHILGISTHFQRARHEPELYWSATANVMLNRKKLSNRHFLPELAKSTEDMELLFRNAYENGLQKYRSVPDAVVHHPWWHTGTETKKLLSYGEGAGEAARLFPVSLYNYYDFPNTLETLLLIAVSSLPVLFSGWSCKWLLDVAITQIMAEVLTNFGRSIRIGHTYNPLVAAQVTWYKNVMEAGRLWSWLRKGKVSEFALRTDGSFRKPHPAPFRLNRWKIIKLLLFLLITAFLFWLNA